ncbi:MAG: hypothetical protein JO363_06340 [Solirubrobacterales bacterium]|nr:hypothetical protein [Solirubrobacterales bacterium]
MTERGADTEEVEQPSVVGEVDRPAVDDAQERDRATVLGQDRRAGEEELDLGVRRNLAELLWRQRVEGCPRGEEARDLAQRRVQR